MFIYSWLAFLYISLLLPLFLLLLSSSYSLFVVAIFSIKFQFKFLPEPPSPLIGSLPSPPHSLSPSLSPSTSVRRFDFYLRLVDIIAAEPSKITTNRNFLSIFLAIPILLFLLLALLLLLSN